MEGMATKLAWCMDTKANTLSNKAYVCLELSILERL